jgi:uncharacterized membrane-anchored protein YitT (DUF2179 family)
MVALRSQVRDYVILALGTLLLSVGFAVFLVPARISPGGVSGLAVVLHYLFALPTGLLVFILNVPLLIAGYVFLGGARFTVRTLFSVALFSVTVDPIAHLIHPLTRDAFLATLYGSMISGLGVGLVFGRGASTGGSTIVARMVQRLTHLSAGFAQMLVDGVVVCSSGLLFGPQLALYGLIGLFVSGKAIDWALEGLSGERVALIVSPAAEQISARITRDLGRGVTVLAGRGGYTGEARPVLLCVVDRAQEPMLRSLVQTADPGAFVVVTMATTVLGEGFAPLGETRASLLDRLLRAA